MLATVALGGVVSATQDVFADTVVAEQLVARVDGRPILLSEVRARARPRPVQLRTAGAVQQVKTTRAIFSEMLEQLIEEEIVHGIAARMYITVSEAEIDTALDTALDSIAAQNHVDRDVLLLYAVDAGYDRATYRAEVKRQLLRQRVVFRLGGNDRRIGSYPSNDEGRRAWMDRAEKGPFAAEKARACVERWVRW